MNPCDKCHGYGLIGSGERPWLREGQTRTCDKCSGTGTLPEDGAPEEAQIPDSANEESQAPESAPVDNSLPEESATGGILKRIFG